MAENGQYDGSLVFDTKIDTKGFEQGLSELEKSAKGKQLKVEGESGVDESGFEKDKEKLERETQEGIGEAEAKSGINKSGFEADKASLNRQVKTGIEDVEVDTTVDAAGLKEGIDKLTQVAERALEQLKSPFDDGKLPIVVDPQVKTSGATDIMKGIVGSNFLQAGINKIVETAQAGIQLASDLEEVQNVVDVTFGAGKDKIEQFAKTAISSFGLTELQTKQYSSTMGAMMKSMGVSEGAVLSMSEGLTGLVGDMASFYNLDHDAAFDKIRSGISGETEPLKALGINMSVANLEAYALTKGMKKAYDQMTEVEKVQLRYGYIMEQTADAQGDFVRTQDSYANQLRLLQNNLDTMAANIGGMLVPALTSATSWVNSLFAGPETNETQQAIDEAAESLRNLEQDIDNINGNYTRDAVSAQADYRTALRLNEEYDRLRNADRGYGSRTLRLGMSGEDVEALQNQLAALGYAVDLANEVGVFGASTEAALKAYQTDMNLVADGIAGVKTYGALAADDTQRMKNVTQELIDIYPELAQYVGKDGLLMLEKKQVDELCGSYRDLQIEKLAAARVEQIGGSYADALLDLEKLKVLQQQEAQAKEDALKKQMGITNAMSMTNSAISGLHYGNKFSVSDAAAAINAFDAAGGDLAAAIELAAQSNKAVYDLFENGILREELSTDGEIAALAELLLGIQVQGKEKQKVLQTELDAADAHLTQMQSEIAEGEKQVAAALTEYEAAQKALDNLKENGKDAGKQAGTDAGQAAADALLAEKGAVTDSVGTIGKAAQKEAVAYPIRFPVSARSILGQYSSGSHATGLNYVPYDNYLARLHVGEAVLTASEAQTWRAQQQGSIDYHELASAIQSTSGSSNRPIVLQIDGKQIASVLAGHNRSAINSYSMNVAKGMGK